jgi:HAD superfamily phosphoserine phosphatase-like hydrolase
MVFNRFKLALFDMDGTLLDGRSIVFFAEEKNFKGKLFEVLESDVEPYLKSIEIAGFLKGSDSRELLEIFRGIPLQRNAERVAKELGERGIVRVIVSDSYQFIVDDLKERLGFDYAFANNLIIRENIVTGELMLHNRGRRRCAMGRVYSICKDMVLERMCRRLNIKHGEVIAVGNGMVDAGMISKAGLGVAFKAPEELWSYADVVTDDLDVILSYV